MAEKVKIATAAWKGWPMPLRSSRARKATALTVAPIASAARMRETATRTGPRPAAARRRSAPREEETWKKARVPERKAAAQPALIAVADWAASVPPSAL